MGFLFGKTALAQLTDILNIIISLNANKEESKLWDFYSVKQRKAHMLSLHSG